MVERENREANDNWQKPFSLIDNLESSVKSLTSTSNILNSTLQSLYSVTKDFTRLCEQTQITRIYDLHTDEDIKKAQVDILREIQPEITGLFSEVDLLLSSLKAEEDEANTKSDDQRRYLKDLRSTLNNLQNDIITESAIQSDGTISSNHVNTNNKKRRLLEPESRHRLQNKRNRARELSELNQAEAQKNKQQADEVRMLKLNIKKQLDQMDSVDPQNAHGHQESRKAELQHELEKLKEEAASKQKDYNLWLEQRTEDTALSDTRASSTTSFSTDEYITQYSNVLMSIEEASPKIHSPRFITSVIAMANCITQSKRYLQAMKKEKNKYQENDLNSQHSEGYEQIKKLQKALYPFGKTLGTFLELLLADPQTQMIISELSKSFPPDKEKRHNIQQAIVILLEAGIITIDDSRITIKL